METVLSDRLPCGQEAVFVQWGPGIGEFDTRSFCQRTSGHCNAGDAKSRDITGLNGNIVFILMIIADYQSGMH